MQTLKQILDHIYQNGLTEKDCAAIIRKIYRHLSDSCFEYAPSPEQQNILDQLLKLADKTETFFDTQVKP